MGAGILYWFDASGSDVVELERIARKRAKEERPRRALRCAACGHQVSSEGERISVLGTHAHTCTNPHGFTYHIGCFQRAPGCAQVGPSYLEHTWFAGYRWQIAVCGNCGEHLGWLFRGDGSFWGLILARLTAGD